MSKKKRLSQQQRKRKKLLDEDPHCYFCRCDLHLGNCSLKRYADDGENVKFILVCRKKCLKGQKGLLPSKKPKRSSSAARRRRLFTEDPRCAYCRVELEFEDSTVDHKIPRCKGGNNSRENTVLCCNFCNNNKGSKTVSEFRKEFYYLTLEAKLEVK